MHDGSIPVAGRPARDTGGSAGRQADLWQGRIAGGLTAGVLTVVTTLSYAAIAGAPFGASLSAAALLSGLVGALIGGAAAAAIDRRSMQLCSPRASVAVVIAAAGGSALQTLRDPAAALAWLSVCLLLAAAIQALLAALRAGALIRLIPHCVVTGFTLGIAISLAATQLLGLLPVAGLAGSAPLQVFAAIVGMATVVGIALARWAGLNGWSMVAGAALATALAGACAIAEPTLALPVLAPVGPDTRPLVSLLQAWQAWSGGMPPAIWIGLAGYALVIALVNALETLTATLALEEVTQRRHDLNRAMLAAAGGTLLSVATGGLPVARSAATSVSAHAAGARDARALLVALPLIAALALASPWWLDAVPLAVVAGLLLMVGIQLAEQPVRELRRLWHTRRQQPVHLLGELAIALLVAALLLWQGIAVALAGGTLACALQAFVRMRGKVVRRIYTPDDADIARLARGRSRLLRSGDSVRVLEVGQPLIFATIEPALDAIHAVPAGVPIVIVDLSNATMIDASALKALERCASTLATTNRRLALVRPSATAGWELPATDCDVFDTLDGALRDALIPARQAASGRRVPSWLQDVTPASGARPRVLSPAHGTEALDRVEQALRGAVGPLAPLLIRRASAVDPQQLVIELARELPEPERSTFCADALAALRGAEAAASADPTRSRTGDVGSAASAGDRAPVASTAAASALTSDSLALATRALAAHVGPVAGVLVERCALEAASHEALYRALSCHIEDADARRTFLRAAGLHTRAAAAEPPGTAARLALVRASTR